MTNELLNGLENIANNDYINFERLKKELIKYYEKNQSDNNTDILELFNKIKNFEFISNNLYKRINKCIYKKEILKWFDNEYLNIFIFEDLILSFKEILLSDSLSIYYKFLNDEVIKIDSDQDFKFYKSLECEYESTMY